ncbi:MauE/DoxX family redox-associated membrane protein [Bacillus altitudinis]|uniref:MauE/DoxX family redox-associated membrane protein n=1 Tax=Bacillus altitudinis TaxID=293387 RepID=UPI0011A1039B
MKHSLMKTSLYICILFISLLMLYSGFIKVINIYDFINTLYSYKYIPQQLHIIIGLCVPISEILIGLLIWYSPIRNKIIICYTILIMTFVVLLTIHYGSYMPNGCGCLGKSKSTTVNIFSILIDLSLILPAYMYSKIMIYLQKNK